MLLLAAVGYRRWYTNMRTYNDIINARAYIVLRLYVIIKKKKKKLYLYPGGSRRSTNGIFSIGPQVLRQPRWMSQRF
jgi:hypothetical protein